LTVTVTTCVPHTDEKLTLPLCFLTVMLKVAVLLPFTVCELGATWIWPPLLEEALIVPLPAKLFRCRPTLPEPLLIMVKTLAWATMEQGTGVGVAVGAGVGVAVGVGVGVGVGIGIGVGVGVGVAVAFGSGLGVGVGVSVVAVAGVGVGEPVSPAEGSGIKFPGTVLKLKFGTDAS
jgi:hypothetical protein